MCISCIICKFPYHVIQQFLKFKSQATAKSMALVAQPLVPLSVIHASQVFFKPFLSTYFTFIDN